MADDAARAFRHPLSFIRCGLPSAVVSHPLWYSSSYPAACANAIAPSTPAMLPNPGGTM